MEAGGKGEDPLELSAARLLGQEVAGPGWTRPATGGEKRVMMVHITYIRHNSTNC